MDAVYRHVDRAAAALIAKDAGRLIHTVYAYEDGAIQSFKKAERFGIRKVYDLPAIHWRASRLIMEEERHLKPDWADTILGLRDALAKLDQKDEELARADKIFVASRFTAESLLASGLDLNVEVVPYGAPAPRRRKLPDRRRGQPLRLMYAGGLTQAKGLAYLIEALDTCDFNWNITLAGSIGAAVPEQLKNFLNDSRCTWLGQVPNPTVLEHMDMAHVFVFPSLAEGFGLVLLEALSAGLPIIATRNTGAPDVISEGREGFIVPIRDPDAISEKLAFLFDDEYRRQEIAATAISCAEQNSWRKHEDRLWNFLK